MNLIDCFMDEFADEVKVRERNDRESYSLLEVRPRACGHVTDSHRMLSPVLPNSWNSTSPGIGAGRWAVAEQWERSQAPTAGAGRERPGLAALVQHEVWVEPSDLLRSVTWNLGPLGQPQRLPFSKMPGTIWPWEPPLFQLPDHNSSLFSSSSIFFFFVRYKCLKYVCVHMCVYIHIWSEKNKTIYHL